jgi:hypothetical protein
VLPLSIYLLTFIVCFDRPHWYSREAFGIAAVVAGIIVLPTAAGKLPIPFQIVAHSVFLFCFCMLCHGELVRIRPRAHQLTLFYLLLAAGGALGGAFVSIGAPALFTDLLEFHLVAFVGWAVIAVAWTTDRTSPFHTGQRWLFVALVAVTAVMAQRYLIDRTRVGRIDWISDHGWAITIGVAAVMVTAGSVALWKTRLVRAPFWAQLFVLLAVLLSGLFLLQRTASGRQGVVYAARNFYGVIRVVSLPGQGGGARQLIHGTTIHGAQLDFPADRKPTAYYSPSSGIAIAATRLIRDAAGAKGVDMGVVGMGVGTMSAFAQPTDRVRYYEINPEVIKVVKGEGRYFTFVDDSGSAVAVVLGDGRLALERELAGGGSDGFDLLAMDAFSGDAVPMHLVTVEAFRLYAAHLKSEDSILAVNVSNRFIDLEPVIAANASALGFHGLRVNSAGEPPVVTQSSWILLSKNARVLAHPALTVAAARPLKDDLIRFTDTYSNLLRILK